MVVVTMMMFSHHAAYKCHPISSDAFDREPRTHSWISLRCSVETSHHGLACALWRCRYEVVTVSKGQVHVQRGRIP